MALATISNSFTDVILKNIDELPSCSAQWHDIVREIQDIIEPTLILLRRSNTKFETTRSANIRRSEAFCAVLAYADAVVGENMFSNLAWQAKLDKKYGLGILTKLPDLLELLKPI